MKLKNCRDCREEVVWWAFTADICMTLFKGAYEAPSIFAALGASVTVIVNELMSRYQICVGNENNSPAPSLG